MSIIPDLPVLSIRQPWAWAILHAGKDIENRNWATKFRGKFLIHAAKGCTKEEYESAVDYIETYAEKEGLKVPPLAELQRGGIVGMAEIVGCVTYHETDSCWFVGDYGFVLRNVQALAFTPCKGALGFFYPQLAAHERKGAE